MEKTFAEFFAGIGLVRLGLERAGWKAKFANDIDNKKFEMYWENFDDAIETFLPGDIGELASSDVPPVTLATASFPCTDLSLAGYRKGLAGKQSSAFWKFAQLLKDMDGQRPRIVLLENVPGFLTSNGGRDFYDAIAALNALNYSCDAFMLNAANFVPQSRQRLFVIGMFDTPTTQDVSRTLEQRPPGLRWPRLDQFMVQNGNLAWKLLPMPPPPISKAVLSQLVERLPPGSERWWDEERVQYLVDQMSPRHRAVVDTLVGGKKTTYATVYRRVRYGRSMAEVRADGIAGCLRTPKGGSSRQILLTMGRGKLRVRFLTPVEYARLMGAPNYRITVPDNQAYFGFGDAVCVPVIEWIGRRVLNPILAEMTPRSVRIAKTLR